MDFQHTVQMGKKIRLLGPDSDGEYAMEQFGRTAYLNRYQLLTLATTILVELANEEREVDASDSGLQAHSRRDREDPF